MLVNIDFYFSFSCSRIRGTGNSTNIKGISRESSINSREEQYSLDLYYFRKKEGFLKAEIIRFLNKHIRRNPSLKKCSVFTDNNREKIVFLSDAFNKKLTDAHIKKVAHEIVNKVLVRYRNDYLNVKRPVSS